MRKKIVFADIDGTLFDHNTMAIPLSARQALLQAKENGHRIFLCTGRPFPDITEELRGLPLSGMVLACGAHIIAEGKTIYEHPFPTEDLKHLISYMQTHHIEFKLEGSKRNYLTPFAFSLFQEIFTDDRPDNNARARAAMIDAGMLPFSDITEADLLQILKFYIFSESPGAIEAMLHTLPTHIQGFLYENMRSGIANGEITPRSVTKAAGIDRVLAFYGDCERKDTIALGDSLNDMEMIRHAGVGIAMGNAVDALKENADYITKDIADDGFAHALRQMCLI